jgi:hypothetical protein
MDIAALFTEQPFDIDDLIVLKERKTQKEKKDK